MAQVGVGDMRTWVQIDNDPPVPGGLHVEQETIDVSMASATKPDPAWEYIDQRGHFHAYDKDGKLPTTETRTEHVACSMEDHDEDCDGFDITYYVCAICGEKIEAGRVPDYQPKTIPGRMSWEALVEANIERKRRVTVRVDFGDHVAFGVGVSLGIVHAEGSSHGTKVTSRILGAGPLGQRRVPQSARAEDQAPSA